MSLARDLSASGRDLLPERGETEREGAAHPLLELQHLVGNRRTAAEIDAARGRGAPIDPGSRARLERSFGTDLSSVRVHTGPGADRLAGDLGALAFTSGRDIFFPSHAFAPGSSDGLRLLAHEAAHTIQQSRAELARGADGALAVDPDPGFEREAEAAAADVVGGRSARVGAAAEPGAVQRQAVPEVRASQPAASFAPPPVSQAIKAEEQTRLPTLEQAARDMTRWLAMPNPAAHREEIFRTMLLLKGRGTELETEFPTWAGRPLRGALRAGLGENDYIRATSYLKYGTLRLADKLYFAARGAATDEETLFRLLPQVHEQLDEVEKDFDEYTLDVEGDVNWRRAAIGGPKARESIVAGMLRSELSDWELDKALALLSYKELRPIDEIRIAMNRAGTDEAMLFAGLEKARKAPGATQASIEAAYKEAYGDDLVDAIEWELSGDDEDRAKKLLAGTFTTLDKIRYATEGPGTDVDALFDAFAGATDEEKTVFRTQLADTKSDLYKLLEDEIDADEIKRIEALVSGKKNDALVALTAAGATSASKILKTIKMSSGETFALYKRAYGDEQSTELRNLLEQKLDADDHRAVRIILEKEPKDRVASVKARLRWAVEGAGTDEDYIFHVLEHFTDDAVKEELLKDAALLGALESDLSTRDYARVKDLLRPSKLGVEAGVAATEEQIERERSHLTDLISNAGDALSDEAREMRAALDRARADGEISPTELAEIQKFEQQTQASLKVYKQVRDEIESTAETILTTAVAVVISVITVGAAAGAGAAMVAAALAKAALVSAIAKVLAMKVAHGDRFDVFGADGAIAFASGAIDGVMNVVGAGAAKALVGPAVGTVGGAVAGSAARRTFATVGRKVLQEAVEGGISSAPTAFFDAAAREKSWEDGFSGFGDVLVETAAGTAMGAGAGAGISGVTQGVSGLRGLRRGVDVPEAHLAGGATADAPARPLGGADPAARPHGTGLSEPTIHATAVDAGVGDALRVRTTTVDGTHQLKITKSGRIVRCTTCDDLEMLYAHVFAVRDDYVRRLDDIKLLAADPSKVAQAADQLRQLEADLRRTADVFDVSEGVLGPVRPPATFDPLEQPLRPGATPDGPATRVGLVKQPGAVGREGEISRFLEKQRFPARLTAEVDDYWRQKIYGWLERGEVSLSRIMRGLSPEGVDNLYFRTPFGARKIDHAFLEGDRVLLRESKNYAEFATSEKLELQLQKDLWLLDRHPEAIVVWRIGGPGRIDPRTYDLLEAIRERTGNRFQFEVSDGSAQLLPEVEPPKVH